VSELLEAAVDGDVDRACRVTTRLSPDDLTEYLAVTASVVESAGGIDALAITDNLGRQMGSGHVVEVRVGDSAVVIEFMVTQNSGTYLVGIPASAPDVGATPTSDPNPP